MPEIVIADEELMICAENTGKYSEAAEAMIEELVTALQYISQNLLVSGDAAANFASLTEKAERLKNGFLEIMEEEKKIIEELVNQIDAADSYLY